MLNILIILALKYTIKICYGRFYLNNIYSFSTGVVHVTNFTCNSCVDISQLSGPEVGVAVLALHHICFWPGRDSDPSRLLSRQILSQKFIGLTNEFCMCYSAYSLAFTENYKSFKTCNFLQSTHCPLLGEYINLKKTLFYNYKWATLIRNNSSITIVRIFNFYSAFL
jgi:hypothetical protein